MKTQKLSNLITFIFVLSLSYLCTEAKIVQSQEKIAQSANFHVQLLPVGDFTFYERALEKNVSYTRDGNGIIGVVYSSSNPNVFTCFHGFIGPDGFLVSWWNNLWQIGQPNKGYYDRFYTVAQFTADNTNFRPGGENSESLNQCIASFRSMSE